MDPLKKRGRGRPKKILENDNIFSITLKVGDKVYASKGTTALDALKTLPKPEGIFTESFFTLKQGKKKLVKYLTVWQAKRLFFTVSQFYIANDLVSELQ